MFARQNSAEEVSPWAIIKMRAPVRPQGVWERIPATTRPMWLTEEYAIRALRSVWRKQIDPVMIMPHKARIIKGYAISLVRGSRIVRTRIMP